jgi:hypothetical protein
MIAARDGLTKELTLVVLSGIEALRVQHILATEACGNLSALAEDYLFYQQVGMCRLPISTSIGVLVMLSRY